MSDPIKLLIESDVPMPPVGRWHFESIKVGDSFVDPTPTKKIYGAAVSYARRHGWKFTYKKFSKEETQATGVSGGRVWRVQ